MVFLRSLNMKASLNSLKIASAPGELKMRPNRGSKSLKPYCGSQNLFNRIPNLQPVTDYRALSHSQYTNTGLQNDSGAQKMIPRSARAFRAVVLAPGRRSRNAVSPKGLWLAAKGLREIN